MYVRVFGFSIAHIFSSDSLFWFVCLFVWSFNKMDSMELFTCSGLSGKDGEDECGMDPSQKR